MMGHQMERFKVEAPVAPQASFGALIPLPIVVGVCVGVDGPIPALISRSQAP